MRKPNAFLIVLPVAVILCGLAGFLGAKIAVGGVRLSTPAPISSPGTFLSQGGDKTSTAPSPPNSHATDANIASMPDEEFINLLNQKYGTVERIRCEFQYLGYKTDTGARYSAVVRNWKDWVFSNQDEILAWLYQVSKTLQARHGNKPFVFTVVIDQEFHTRQDVPGPFADHVEPTPAGKWRLNMMVAMTGRFEMYPGNIVVEVDGLPGEELNT